jgi:hypothetical protein
VAVVAAFALVVPHILSDVVGLGLGGALIALQYLNRSQPRPASAGAAAVDGSSAKTK